VVWPQNHSDGFRWFGLKTSGDGFFSLALERVATVSPGLTSKPVVVFLVEPQNQCGGGFLGLDLKIDSFDLVIWVSKPSRLRFVGCVTKPTEKGQRGTRVEI
jgi:hypothetical protein